MEFTRELISNMWNFLKSERTRVNLVLLFLPLLLAQFLCLEYKKRLDAGDREAIGEVILQLKDTKRKYSSEVIWETVNVNVPVYNMDTIKTDEFSEIIVRLKDGTEVKLEENSMAVFSFSADQLNIDFSRGGIGLNNAANVKLVSDENRFYVKNGKLSANKGYSQIVDMKIQEGDIQLDSKGKKETLDKDSFVKVKQERVLQQEKVARILTPLSQYFPSSGTKEKIRFEWEPATPKSKYILEVSNANSRSIVVTKNVEGKSAELELPVGNYRWRLAPLSKEEVPVSFARFAVLSQRPLQVMLPLKDQKITVVKETPRIVFRWVKEDFYKNYKLEISNTENFQNVLVQRDSFSDETLVDHLKPGKYYYRVLAKPILGGMESKSSEVRSFEIIGAKKPTAVTLVSPLHKKEFFHDGTKETNYTFVWKKNQEYKSYEFLLSKDSNFTEIVLKETTPEHFMVVKSAIGFGQFYWKVRGVFENERIDSDVRSFHFINGQRIKLLSPLGQESYEAGNLEFSWSNVSPGSKYVLDIAKDLNFKTKLQTYTSDKNFLSLPILEPGRYFWRVRLGESNDSRIRYDLGEFKIKPEPQVTILYPLDKSQVDLSPVDEVSFSWKPLEDAKEYEMELVRLPERKSILKKTKLKKTNYLIQDLKIFKRGQYEVRVRALVFDSKGERYSKETISKFEIILSQISTKEDLKFITPEEIFVE
jgi:hypothetical protein